MRTSLCWFAFFPSHGTRPSRPGNKTTLEELACLQEGPCRADVSTFPGCRFSEGFYRARGRTSKTAPSTITAAPIKTWTMNPVPSVSSPAITTELVKITMIPVTTRASPATFLRATIRTPGRNRASNIKVFFSYLVLNITEQIQKEGGQSVSRLGELDHSLLVKIPFLAAYPPLWAFPRRGSNPFVLLSLEGGPKGI